MMLEVFLPFVFAATVVLLLTRKFWVNAGSVIES